MSRAQAFLERVAELGADAPAALRECLAAITPLEFAALEHHWDYWRRPSQTIPISGWRTFGQYGARGRGKTAANVRFIQDEVFAGRARRIGFCAQNEDRTIEVQVFGVNGLITTAPPWNPARFTGGRVEWANGAVGLPYTPEVPGAIKGDEYSLFWASEVDVWPETKALETWNNIGFSTRLGSYARIIWDGNPNAYRTPELVKLLLALHREHPEAHRIVRGSVYENALFLAPGFIAQQEALHLGTPKGRAEILGLDPPEGVEAALWRQTWIDEGRTAAPATFVRRVVAIDPNAGGDKYGADRTGISEAALGRDGKVYILGDHSDRHSYPEWARIAVGIYIEHSDTDVIVLEGNRVEAGALANLEVEIKDRGWTMRKLDEAEPAARRHKTVNVRVVKSRGPKGDRAAPIAGLYAKRLVVHPLGVNLGDLEDLETTWVPDPEGRTRRSPDALDALVHAVNELFGLGKAKAPIDASAGFQGLAAAATRATHGPMTSGRGLGSLAGAGGGDPYAELRKRIEREQRTGRPWGGGGNSRSKMGP